MDSVPQRLLDTPRDMVWGVMQTVGPYLGLRIGEIWFDAGVLLIKFITTAAKLSVQVHPGDEYAARHETDRGGRGKTELWHVMEAAPEARIALGLTGRTPQRSRDDLHRSATGGTLEQELCWTDVTAGETIFVPAGTVHALGAGLTICEIQQHSDITYRLYDYGRLDRGQPRELHLERALDVMAGDRGLGLGAGIVALPFRCEYFAVEPLTAYVVAEAADDMAINVSSAAALNVAGLEAVEHPAPLQVGAGHWVVLDGEGMIGGRPYGPREVWRIPTPAEWRPARTTQTLLVNP